MSVLRGSELVGRVVGGRYRLLRPVGSGASAHVYVAEDIRLRRRVALKLLHPALAQDRSFQRRFQAEAQTVANLRHPGIVRVYDWGDDDDGAFLAMELLEGGSLRSLLDSGYRLSTSQAAALGLDVAAALSYAHGRGLVHRDIKPANLLFDEEGHASVADFGIARALAEASWTEPMGALVGTARYAAPEQLRGVALDGKADVYALALVLVEAVTGEVPFALDTTLGALIARASTPVPVPAELGLLGPVIEHAGLADPELRPSAEAVAQEIASVARHLRAPAPLPLHRLPSATTEGREDHTELASGRRIPLDEGLSILVDDLPDDAPVIIEGPDDELLSIPPFVAEASAEVAVGPEADDNAHANGSANTGAGAQLRPAPSLGTAAAPDPGAPSPGSRRTQAAPVTRHRRRWLWRSLLVLLVVLLAAGGATAYIYLTRPPPPPPPPPTYAVPDVAGDTVPAAGAALASDHLALAVGARQWSATVAKGAVISQYPVPGTRLLAHKVVAVTVSRGPQPVAVPSLATLDLAQARAFLEATGLHMGKVTRHTSTTVPAGIVVSWSDRGRRLLPGSAVNLVVSAGKPMATIPASADGMTFSRLDAELVALRFPVTEYRYYSNTVPAGEVISTDPTAGSIEVVGTPVAVNVSLGPHLVTIPSSVVGLSDGQAAKVLAGIGLYVSRVAGSPLEPVQGTQPAVGTQVLYDSSIVLVTSG